MKRVFLLFTVASLLLTVVVACSATENDYADVPTDAWYSEAVMSLREKGVMDGMGNDRFGPDEPFTRAQLATVLYRMAGKPPVSGEDSFTDTKSGLWYSDAVLWASQNQVVNGYGNGMFGTNDPTTQEQLAVMLWRDAGSYVSGEEYSAEDGLEKDASDWAVDAVRWARTEGLLADAVPFMPTSNASRAQVADMIYRYLMLPERSPNGNGISSATEKTDVKEVIVSFDFTRMSTHASNQYAVWIEDADGRLVKTLFVPNFTAARRGYLTREDAIPSWVSAANPNAMTDLELDAVSGATPGGGVQTFSWDMTDAEEKTVPDGVYRIMVEGTLYWSSTVLYTAELDTATAKAGDLTVSETRSEPNNKDNETMIDHVKISVSVEEQQ